MRCRTPVRSCSRGQVEAGTRSGLEPPVTRKNAPLSVDELLPCGRCVVLQVAWLQGGGCCRATCKSGAPWKPGGDTVLSVPVVLCAGSSAGDLGCASRGNRRPRREGAELPARDAAPRCASCAARTAGWAPGACARPQRAGAPPACARTSVRAHDAIGASARSAGDGWWSSLSARPESGSAPPVGYRAAPTRQHAGVSRSPHRCRSRLPGMSSCQ